MPEVPATIAITRAGPVGREDIVDWISGRDGIVGTIVALGVYDLERARCEEDL